MAKLFGFSIDDEDKKSKDIVSPVTPNDEDGSDYYLSSGFYGQYVDIEGVYKTEFDIIRKYRNMALHPECDTAIEHVVNEAIVSDLNDSPIEIDLDNISIISLYLPSGSSGEERQRFKYKVLDKILEVLEKKLKIGKNIVVCGDFNIAHHEIDLKNFKGNKKNSGFLSEERAWLSNLFIEVGWVDIYRNLYPKKGEEGYTWWSNRGQAWAKNVGWRIDYQITNKELAKKAKKAMVFKTKRFSDHAPLIIHYDDF